MKLFNTLCLEIDSTCNRKCQFCPVAYNQRPDELMTPDLISKALTELAGLKYRGRVELYIYNEPCRNFEHLLNVLRMFSTALPGVTFMVASNGDYLDGPRMAELYGAGLQQLLVNCYTPGLFEKRQSWLEWLPDDVEVDGPIYTKLARGKRTFQMLDKSNPDEFGSGVFGLTNRSGLLEGYLPPTPEPLERMCVRPFRVLNVNWQGDAMVCCNDYHADVEVGSLHDLTLLELWHHPVMNLYRTKLLDRDRSLPLCDVCDCHAGAYPGNVDTCLLYTSPSPRDQRGSRMPSSA